MFDLCEEYDLRFAIIYDRYAPVETLTDALSKALFLEGSASSFSAPATPSAIDCGDSEISGGSFVSAVSNILTTRQGSEDPLNNISSSNRKDNEECENWSSSSSLTAIKALSKKTTTEIRNLLHQVEQSQPRNIEQLKDR